MRQRQQPWVDSEPLLRVSATRTNGMWTGLSSTWQVFGHFQRGGATPGLLLPEVPDLLTACEFDLKKFWPNARTGIERA